VDHGLSKHLCLLPTVATSINQISFDKIGSKGNEKSEEIFHEKQSFLLQGQMDLNSKGG
jgi:hypothetical protein